MPSKRKRTSEVWDHFTKDEASIDAQCNYCPRKMKTPQGCTTGMKRHLKKHKIFLNKNDELNRPASELDNPKTMLSKLVAKDGFPFSALTTSTTLRLLFEKVTGSCLPRSPSTVRELMLQYYAERKAGVTDEISRVKMQGGKLSLTLDEWTSGANRRYMNINIHTTGKFWNLGLARIRGSLTAEACKAILESKLFEFHVLLTDVFGVATDGASTMKKLGHLLKRKHVLCMAHGIHLAVVDVLYKKKEIAQVEVDSDQIFELDEADGEQNYDQEDESDSNREDNGIEGESDSETEDVELEIVEPPVCDMPHVETELNSSLREVIAKVRKTVKVFRKSAMKLEVLHKYSNSGASLIIDTKTRWNSLLDMLERLISMKDAIKKAMIDINECLLLTENDFLAIEELVDVLKPVKVAVDALCRRDANLVTADVAINFMMEKIQSYQSAVGIKLFGELKRRIVERRTILSDIASYLHFGEENGFAGYNLGWFSKKSRHTLISNMKTIYEMAGPPEPQPMTSTSFNPHVAEETNTELSESLMLELSLETELSMKINQAMSIKLHGTSARPSRDPSAALLADIKREMATFENSGNRGKCLEVVHKCVMSVPPTTVESERVFSSANNFCRKIRTKLADRSLDALVFLKAIFNEK